MALKAKFPDLVDRRPKVAVGGRTDDSILLGLARREPWAAAALYERIEPTVERAIYRILRQRSTDFEDLMQITFERIVKTLVERRFESQCSLVTWAAAIATNVAIDSVRRRIRERRLFAGLALDEVDRRWVPSASTASNQEVRAEATELLAVFSHMNPGQAEALFLSDVMGHDLAEIAEIVGVTVAAAQSRLVRGRKDFMRRVKKGTFIRRNTELSHSEELGSSDEDDDGGQVS